VYSRITSGRASGGRGLGSVQQDNLWCGFKRGRAGKCTAE
jgi:hypothetical protein